MQCEHTYSSASISTTTSSVYQGCSMLFTYRTFSSLRVQSIVFKHLPEFWQGTILLQIISDFPQQFALLLVKQIAFIKTYDIYTVTYKVMSAMACSCIINLVIALLDLRLYSLNDMHYCPDYYLTTRSHYQARPLLNQSTCS